MTMIGFATYGDHAELITDTLSYTLNLNRMRRCSKHFAIAHLDAVVMTRGDNAFNTYAAAAVLTVSQEADDFDELVELAPGLLQSLWSNHAADHERIEVSTLYLMGYSPEQKKFTAYMFVSDRDFKKVRVHGAFIMPTPWDFAPTGYELRELKDPVTDWPGTSMETRLEAAERWRQQPVLPRPESIDQWRDLALLVRKQRSLNPFYGWLVGGQVMHCRVERGRSITTAIHAFDDTGEELAKMVAATSHPVAQRAPCWCGSRLAFRDCHLASYFAEGHTCDCQSGRSFEDCCRVPDAEMPTRRRSLT